MSVEERELPPRQGTSAGDDKDKPTGGTRVVLYQMAKTDNGGDNGTTYHFTLVRHYDTQ